MIGTNRLLRSPTELGAIERVLIELRAKFEKGFTLESAAHGFPGTTQSTGQCAAVSVLMQRLLGAAMVSAVVAGQSHWFNRLRVGEEPYDVDLTGDQFGFPIVQIAPAGQLYPDTRVRRVDEVTSDTVQRADILADRCGMEGSVGRP